MPISPRQYNGLSTLVPSYMILMRSTSLKRVEEIQAGGELCGKGKEGLAGSGGIFGKAGFKKSPRVMEIQKLRIGR